MVDKENQWDDIEYTGDEAEYSEAEEQEEYSEEEYDSTEYEEEEYSEEYEDGNEEYEEDEEYEDEYEEDEESGGRKSSAAPLIAILLVILLLAGAGYFAYTKFMGGSGSIAKTPAKANNESVEFFNNDGTNSQNDINNNQNAPVHNGENTQDMGDFFFNEAGGNDSDMMSVDFNENGQTTVTQPQEGEDANQNGEGMVVATVTEQPETSENELSPDDLFNEGGFNANEEEGNNAIMVSYNKEARVNPFKPPVASKNDEYEDGNDTGFEIIEPPTSSIQDENLKRLLQTQISGIMYDEESPSAIVNLNGVDQFVKVGDEIFGYRIDEISKNKVQISYKNNSYVASVGELFTRGLLEKNPAVANFENKFAGKYRENN